MSHNSRAWYRTWPFAILCLLASTIWLLLDRYPQITFNSSSDAIACAVAAAFSLGMAVASRTPRPELAEMLHYAFAGALVLAGPAAGTFLHVPFVSPGGLAIALALTPVVIAVAGSAFGNDEFSADHLWPGLAAAVALLLMLPMPSLLDPRGDLALILAPILTGIGCVLFGRGEMSSAWKISVGFTGATLVFGLAALGNIVAQRALPAISPAAVAIDALLFALTLVALNRLTASQYASRYALVPLLLLLQGPLLLHAWITWRSAGCAILLLAAAIAMLRSGSSEKVTEEILEDHSLRG